MKAIFEGITIAESNDTILLENNHYFPPSSVKKEFLKDSGNDYECPWKGHADYYNVYVGKKIVEDGAWMYTKPNPAAQQIAGYYAFWKDIKVSE